MKKLMLLLLSLLPLATFAQQTHEEYAAYLEQAITAAKNNDAKKFNTNLRYFSKAIQRDNISPATLDENNRKLYMEALFQALSYANFDISDETAGKAVKFIRYDIDNHPRQLFALGRLYFYGKGVEQSYAQAKYWYEKAAAKGDDFAMNNLGLMYFDGKGVDEDYAKAKYWFEKSAELGDEVAISNLGVLYEYGYGVEQDYDKAISYYKKAADMGEPVGMNKLGIVYEEGKGVTQDYAKAKFWYEKAAEKGGADGMENLGDLYYYDDKLTKDYAKARYWYEKAAKKGNDGAMNNLGHIHHNGYGVDKDYTKARYWWEKAMKKGNTGAMVNLGWLYDYGHGVAFDWEKAFQWYKKAADLGNASGLRLAGEFYLFGVGGVQKNKSKAIALFEKAKEKGDKKAVFYLQALSDIEHKKYYELNTSPYGNRIYISDESLTYIQQHVPDMMNSYISRWEIPVYYKKTTEGTVTIKGTYFYAKTYPDDEIKPNQARRPEPMSPDSGYFDYYIKIRTDNGYGYRAIGYNYITGYFPNNDKVNIKIPMALCMLPRTDYK